MKRQFGDVAASLSKRGKLDFTDIEPVEQVFPELALPYEFSQIPIRCAHNPNINFMRFGLPNWLYQTILEYPEKFALGRKRQIPKFIEEEGPFIRCIEFAYLVVYGAGEGPLLMAEQKAFNEILRNRCTVYGE